MRSVCMNPYKLSPTQALEDGDKPMRIEFARWLQETNDCLGHFMD
jgi:hypothetical protein